MRKIFQKLYVKVVLCFLLIITVFVILMGLIFNRLLARSTISSYYNMMSSQAQVIAERMGRYIISNDIEDYSNYMATLQDTISADVWIISNPTAYTPMNTDLENIKLTDDELTKDNKHVLYEAYKGKMDSVTAYNEMYGMTTITVGAPIYNEEEDVVGAVLLLSPLETVDITENKTFVAFAISIMISLLISIILAFWLTRRLTRPISKIRYTTKRLAEGEYSAKTDIKEKNEIGELAATVDILALKLKESEKERADMDRVRQDFFSNVSHELRTPITVMRAYLESLVDDVVPADKHNQYYERMLSECTGMQRLVQDLLLLSKMENPDFTIEKEPVNLVQVFDDIIRNLRLVCNQKGLNIKFTTDKEYCFLLGDYDRIRQVFLAILDNAIKFSHFGGTIYINIESQDKLIVSVRDEGDGMSEDELSHIFDKFYTKRQTNNLNGSGLGLVIVRHLVEKHDGLISVESKEGSGTVFQFTFNQIDPNEEDSIFYQS